MIGPKCARVLPLGLRVFNARRYPNAFRVVACVNTFSEEFSDVKNDAPGDGIGFSVRLLVGFCLGC